MSNIEVKVSKVEKENSRLVGFADILIDKAIVVHKVRLIEKDGKRFLAFPSIKKFNTETNEYEYADVVHPINAEARKLLEDAVFSEFDKLD